MNNTNTIDLLFTLVISFVVLFSLSIMLINESNKDSDGDVDSQNEFIVTLNWDKNCDVDLWMLLPDGRRVFYSERNQPPAFLDIDVTCWNSYYGENTGTHIIKNNQEIITVRDVMTGDYSINAHLFQPMYEEYVEIEVLVYDIRNRKVIYADSRTLTLEKPQEHIVNFTVEEGRLSLFSIVNVDDSNPIYFVGGQ